MSLPDVSVVVRTQPGRASILRTSLRSILGQTHTNLEVILVEDGGHSYADLLNDINDSRIVYLPCEKMGRSEAGNAGLSACTGGYVNFLDDDDLFFEHHVATLLNALRGNPGYRVAFSNAIELKSEVVRSETDTFVHRESDFYQFFSNQYNMLRLLQHNLMPIQAVLFERSLFVDYGGMHPDQDGLEDWLLWLKYACTGPFLHVDQFTSLFRTPMDSGIAQAREEKILSHKKFVNERLGELYPKNVSLAELKCYHTEYTDLIDHLNADIGNLRSHIDQLNSDRLTHETTIRNLEDAHHRAAADLQQVTSSISWKVTRPLRAISRSYCNFINRQASDPR